MGNKSGSERNLTLQAPVESPSGDRLMELLKLHNSNRIDYNVRKWETVKFFQTIVSALIGATVAALLAVFATSRPVHFDVLMRVCLPCQQAPLLLRFLRSSASDANHDSSFKKNFRHSSWLSFSDSMSRYRLTDAGWSPTDIFFPGSGESLATEQANQPQSMLRTGSMQGQGVTGSLASSDSSSSSRWPHRPSCWPPASCSSSRYLLTSALSRTLRQVTRFYQAADRTKVLPTVV